MKKLPLGAFPFIYPMPTVIVGTIINKEPNFITISYVGVVQHTPAIISISLIKSHLTNKGIHANKTFSINIPNTRMLKKTDFVGMNSGDCVDKAGLFTLFNGELKNAPMILEAPLNLECKLVNVFDLNGDSEIFFGEVVQTYSSARYVRRGYPYMKKLDPILFSINSNSYYNVGRRIGRAWKEGLKVNISKYRKNK